MALLRKVSPWIKDLMVGFGMEGTEELIDRKSVV